MKTTVIVSHLGPARSNFSCALLRVQNSLSIIQGALNSLTTSPLPLDWHRSKVKYHCSLPSFDSHILSFTSTQWILPISGGKVMGGQEGGIRVPTAISWPGHIPPDVTIDVPTSQMDVLPTLLDVIDVHAAHRQGVGREVLTATTDGTGIQVAAHNHVPLLCPLAPRSQIHTRLRYVGTTGTPVLDPLSCMLHHLVLHLLTSGQPAS